MEISLTQLEKYRQQGDEFFAKLKQPEHTAPVVRREHYTDALKCYNQALNASMNDDERASAYKNLAVLFDYQIGSYSTELMDENDLDYTLKECITSYGHAFEYGKAAKSNEWLTVLCGQIDDFVYGRCATFLMLPADERLRVLLFIANCFEHTALEKLDSLAAVYFSIGQLTFEKAVAHFKEEPRLIYDCRPHLDRALYWTNKPSKFRSEEMDELRCSIWLHQCMHESANARRAGIRMLEAHMNDDEELNMDTVWNIIDTFREAILLAKEHDIKGEALGCHHTAKVYQNVLKMTELAYTYHLRCITLAQTLVPRNLTSLCWYMTSSSFVQQHRARNAREEEAIDEELTKNFRIELASDLEELDKKAKHGTYELLQHIYTKYPPRKEDAQMGSTKSDDLSKTVKKAILHYHPDSQASFNDKKWTFLCGEITKLLNIKYQILKLAS